MQKESKKIQWHLKNVIICFVVFVCYFVYRRFLRLEVGPTNEEVFIQLQLNTKEDIGLLIYDYEVNGNMFSEGIANADRSMLKHDGTVTLSFSKEHLKVSQPSVKMKIQFRVITQYMNPNYENIYPEELTKSIEELNLNMEFGKIYYMELVGDTTHGYQIIESSD